MNAVREEEITVAITVMLILTGWPVKPRNVPCKCSPIVSDKIQLNLLYEYGCETTHPAYFPFRIHTVKLGTLVMDNIDVNVEITFKIVNWQVDFSWDVEILLFLI